MKYQITVGYKAWDEKTGLAVTDTQTAAELPEMSLAFKLYQFLLSELDTAARAARLAAGK